MEILIAIAISSITALFIVLPFFLRSGKEGSNANEASRAADPTLERLKALQGRKESLFSAIRDIDLDYGLGKLTVEDYEELRQKYRIEAASILKEIDGITKDSGTGDLDSGIEDEILRARGVSSQTGEELEIEREILLARKPAQAEFSVQTTTSCPDCGHESLQDDLFCSKCGSKLNG